MKTFSKLTTAAMAAALFAMASTPASAARCFTTTALKADSLTMNPDLIRSNVPTCDGDFVSGFQIIGGGGISWYADAHHADRCFDVDVTFLPSDVSAYDMDAVLDYLGLDSSSIDVFRKVTVDCRR